MVLHDLPDYSYESVSEHLVNVFPVGAKKDSRDLLNVPVPRLDIVGKQAGDVLSRPRDFIPQLAERLEGPTKGRAVAGSILSDVGPPPITLHLKDVTVRQVLNAASEATGEFPAEYMPYGWVYSFDPEPQLPAGGSILGACFGACPTTGRRKSTDRE